MAWAVNHWENSILKAPPPAWHEDRTLVEKSGHTAPRLSIAVLDDQAKLWRLLGVLAEFGIPPSQCSLWGLTGIISNLQVPPAIAEPCRGDLWTLLTDNDKCVTLSSGCILAVRSGASFDRLLRDAREQPPHWMHSELRAKLADQAADGGVVLLVSACNSGEHALAARLLLHYGSYDLHTHEFTLRD